MFPFHDTVEKPDDVIHFFMHGFIINAVIFQHLFAESKFLGRDGIKTLQNNSTRFLKRQLPFNVFFFYVDNFPALGFIKTENIVHCFSHISSLYNRLHIVILCKISISRKVNICHAILPIRHTFPACKPAG